MHHQFLFNVSSTPPEHVQYFYPVGECVELVSDSADGRGDVVISVDIRICLYERIPEIAFGVTHATHDT